MKYYANCMGAHCYADYVERICDTDSDLWITGLNEIRQKMMPQLDQVTGLLWEGEK